MRPDQVKRLISRPDIRGDADFVVVGVEWVRQ